ncbi:MAG TPA: hypothetical protein VMA72_27110 [Streptosporangiaceae bacterium]|nr:hypothetical protein [Streptosporangiaceae bacterium]
MANRLLHIASLPVLIVPMRRDVTVSVPSAAAEPTTVTEPA